MAKNKFFIYRAELRVRKILEIQKKIKIMVCLRRCRDAFGSAFGSIGSINAMTSVTLNLLNYVCFLCLIINPNSDATMAEGSYAEADEFFNELDRPSK